MFQPFVQLALRQGAPVISVVLYISKSVNFAPHPKNFAGMEDNIRRVIGLIHGVHPASATRRSIGTSAPSPA